VNIFFSKKKNFVETLHRTKPDRRDLLKNLIKSFKLLHAVEYKRKSFPCTSLKTGRKEGRKNNRRSELKTSETRKKFDKTHYITLNLNTSNQEKGRKEN
jgi:hypothetical protein